MHDLYIRVLDTQSGEGTTATKGTIEAVITGQESAANI
jgi:hypothetical protein